MIVKLNLGSSAAWRRIITPSDITFKQLHAIIQVSFDWKESHLHEFEIFDQAGRCVMNVISEIEDIGGISGYGEFLKIMADPKHEEYKSTRQWVQSQWYKDFDIELVNRRLKNVLRCSLL